MDPSLVRPALVPLRVIAESMIAESRIVLAVGARRTGKTTIARLLAGLASRLGKTGRPFAVDPDGQLVNGFRLVELDAAGPHGIPSWCPPGAYPFAHRGIALVDEAQSADSGDERRALRALVQRAGPHGLSVVLTSQRPADLASACPAAARLVDWLIAGRCTFPADLEYLERTIGVDTARIRGLPPHNFLVYRLYA
jgi:energy-coupling factor transporter ATP-binding protein EcfA2